MHTNNLVTWLFGLFVASCALSPCRAGEGETPLEPTWKVVSSATEVEQCDIGVLALTCLNSKKPLLEAVSKRANLEYLDVSDDLSDEDCGYIAPLKNLKYLNLSHCKVSAAGLKKIQSCKSLVVLIMAQCSLVDEDVAAVVGIESLQELSFHGCKQLTDNGIRKCSGLLKLGKLGLGQTEITGTAFGNADAWLCLRSLSILKCRSVSDEGASCIGRLVNLTNVVASACSKLSHIGIRAICTLPQLQSLELVGLDFCHPGY